MPNKKILILQGSIKAASSNQQLAGFLMSRHKRLVDWQLSLPLDQLPFFNPAIDAVNISTTTLYPVVQFRAQVEAADGILIMSPEYVFSLPGVLKNALEWLVSTTILTDKPTGILIAAASGEKAQKQLALLLRTLGAKTSPQASLLIKGIKGKIQDGSISDEQLIRQLDCFTEGLLAFYRK